MASLKCIGRDLIAFRKSVILILMPFILLPLLIGSISGRETKCAYVVLLMTTYWISECLPLPVTAFLPIFLFPLLGVLNVKDTCANYLKETNFLFVGGLIIAVATEECHLHRRIALNVLCKMGAKPHWLTMGFMVTAAFLSMWMSNVAATAMMIPIVLSILDELISHHKHTKQHDVNGNVSNANSMPNAVSKATIDNRVESTATILPKSSVSDSEMNRCLSYTTNNSSGIGFEVDIDEIKENLVFSDPTTFIEMSVQTEDTMMSNAENKIELQHELKLMPQHIKGLCKAILLSICYGANLGGTGTLTGTGPNIVLSGQLSEFFPEQEDVTFARWMAFAIPPMLLCLFFTWIWLLINFLGFGSLLNIFCGKKKEDEDSIDEMLQKKRKGLGNISFAEISVLFWFTILVFLWIAREPVFVPGWQSWLGIKKGLSSDACAAMLVACILFAWPNEPPDFCCFRKNTDKKPIKRSALMTWSAMQKKFPWSIIMLLGGGYAMADGIKSSGLDLWIGCSIQQIVGHLSAFGILWVVVILVTIMTTLASNSATATIFIPILISLAQILKVNPLFLVLPATLSASYAFILPIATPPNAVVYETKMVSLKEMIFSGIVMSVTCVLINILNTVTLAYYIFDLGASEKWHSESLSSNTSTCLT